MTFKDTMNNNLLLSCLGVTFVNPTFRVLTAQYPYEVTVFTLCHQDEKKKERSFKKLLDQNQQPFIVIVRGGNAQLEDVLFVPSKEQRDDKTVPALIH
jgi:hypothetical protein